MSSPWGADDGRRQGSKGHGRGGGLLAVACVAGAVALGVYALGPAGDGARPRAPLATSTPEILPPCPAMPTPPAVPTPTPPPSDPWLRVGGTLRPGQTVSAALIAGGVGPVAAQEAIEVLGKLVRFRNARPGDRYAVAVDETGAVRHFEYRTTTLEHYVAEEVEVEAADGERRLVARQIEVPVTKRIVGIGGRLKSSLYETLQSLDVDPALAFLLVDAFAWDIDFYLDPRNGDTFRMLVEQLVVDGQPRGYASLLAAEYNGEVVSVRGFRHAEEGGGAGYYAADGQNLQKTFLKSPLKYARVTSSFGRRVHPVLGFSHNHNGIDFAAPRGTPVWAAADGNVLRAGWIGACGKAVFLRHPTGHETQYCHLSRIAPGVKVGARVAQKQVIGAVGSTGRSTGPHLHYGMKLRGRFLHPLNQVFPRGKPLPPEALPDFRRDVEWAAAQLESIPIPGSVFLVRQDG